MFASKNSMRNHLDDEMLSAYIDRALPAGEMQSARRHLDACPECRRRLENLQSVVRLLQALPAVEVPRSFVLRPADVEPARPRAAFTFLRAATVAVAMMLAVVLAGDLLLRQGMLGMPAAPAPVMERAAVPTPATLIAEAPALVTPEAVPATQPAEEPAAKARIAPAPAPTEAPPAAPEAGAVAELLAAPTPPEVPIPTETPAGTPEMAAAAGIEVSATPPALPEATPTPGAEVTLTAPAVALPQVAVAAASETPAVEEPTAAALEKTSPLPTPAEGTPGASPSEVVVEPPVTSPDEVPAPPGAGGGGAVGGAGGIGGGAPATEPMRAGALTQTATVEASPSLTAEAVEEQTPTPTPTPTPAPATPTATPTPPPTPTPLPPTAVVRQTTPEAQEPATAVAQRAVPAAPATSAAPEQAPAPAPQTGQAAGFFNEDTLFLIRLVEIALALIVVSLAGATWVVRPRA